MSVEQTIVRLLEKVHANPQGISGFSAVYHFLVSGAEGGAFQVRFENNRATYVKGTPDEAGCVIELSDENFNKLVEGKLSPTTAFMLGKLKLKGDMSLALKLQSIFKTYQS
jgi:putative sterol carrier protein